ncbi:amidohydrolase [Phytohabitans sp. LJ34]|uniref:amidohydrolase n=1 Tax=Phytohabitans sp. LJ34 TaxID=3452217 RepID=UPI003F8BDABF
MHRDGDTAMPGLGRRNLLKTGAAVGVAGVVATPAAASAHGSPDRTALVNGRIHTMDKRDSVVDAVLVEDGAFAAVGRGVPRGGPGLKVIDLRGRTVVPGIIEGHVHIVSLANRPGYHVVIENARDIAEIQQMLAKRRRGVPPGEFVTAMGGWHPNMFAERRVPTLAELDEAVPDRPVLLFQSFSGPARTNSLGKAFLETASIPVVVAADGTIAAGAQSTTALYHLRVRQTFEDKKRSTRDAMAYSASVGLTASLDQVLFPSPGPLTPTQSLSNLDHYRMYDPWLAVHADGDAIVRLQTNFLHNQNDIALPELKERLRNVFPLFGDDMLMTGAIGEWGAPGDGSGAAWLEAQRVIAQAGWRNTNRALSLAQFENIVAAYEAVDAEFGIKDLRWTVHHVPFVTRDLLARLAALGGSVQVGTFRYPSGTAGASGSPFRSILDSGIPHAGIHMDGVHIAPLNPFFGLYFAVTGRNALGDQINEAERITRVEALRMFTANNAWHLNMEDKIGSIEQGKLADLVVLDRDYFSVPEEDVKRIRPVLTMVGGKVVYQR